MSEGAGKLQARTLAIARPIVKALWRIKVSGLDNLPLHGGVILAPNHTSVLDSFFLPVVLPRRISYVGKAEYLDDWKTRRLFPALGMIPIDRSSGHASARALDTAARVLEAGELFGIFPEGTRSRSGVLYKGHTGAARLSVRTGSPIVPVGLLGIRAIQPPDARLPKVFRPVEIRFGRPIQPVHSTSAGDARLRLRQMTDEVMYEIRELTGQDYVDTYARKVQAKDTATDTVDTKPDESERRSSADVLRSVSA